MAFGLEVVLKVVDQRNDRHQNEEEWRDVG